MVAGFSALPPPQKMMQQSLPLADQNGVRTKGAGGFAYCWQAERFLVEESTQAEGGMGGMDGGEDLFWASLVKKVPQEARKY